MPPAHENWRMAFEAALTASLRRWGMAPRLDQLDRLFAHFEAVLNANRVMNLTRITDPADAAVKHYADSLALLLWVRDRGIRAQTVLDVGTGAGFPAVPLAVMRPDWSVTGIEATQKKADFLTRTAAALGLANLECLHAHSSHWHADRAFDLVLTRAIALPPKTRRPIERFVSPGGHLVAYRAGPTRGAHADRATDVTPPAGLTLTECYAYDLILGDERLARALHIHRKGPDTPTT